MQVNSREIIIYNEHWSKFAIRKEAALSYSLCLPALGLCEHIRRSYSLLITHTQRRHISRPAAPAFINQNCIDITWHKVKQCPLAE